MSLDAYRELPALDEHLHALAESSRGRMARVVSADGHMVTVEVPSTGGWDGPLGPYPASTTGLGAGSVGVLVPMRGNGALFVSVGGRAETQQFDARRWFVGDGVTDNHTDAATMLTDVAAAGGGEIVFPPGEYLFNNAGSSLWFTHGNLTLRGMPGAVLRIPDSGVGLNIGGPDPTYNVTTVTAAIPEGSNQITVASAAGLSVGQDIVIRSETEIWNPERGLQDTKSEWAQIAAISGTTVTLEAPTRDSYSITGHTVRIDTYSLVENVTLDGLHVIGGGAGQTQQLIRVNRARNVKVRNCTVESGETMGISIGRCHDVLIEGNTVAYADQSSLGYGIQVTGCENVTISGNHGHHNRHSFDVNGHGGLFANNGSQEPNSRNITISGNTAQYDYSSGITTHACSMVHITGNHVSGCGGGIQVRGMNVTVAENTIDGTYHTVHVEAPKWPIQVGTGNTTEDRWQPYSGRGLRIIGNRIRAYAEPGAAGTRGIVLSSALEDAVIANNVVSGSTIDALLISGSVLTNVVIEGNVIQATSGRGVAWEANTGYSARHAENLRIMGNSIRGTSEGVRLTCADGTSTSRNVVVSDNTIPGATTGVNVSYIDVSAGLVVEGNVAPDTAPNNMPLRSTSRLGTSPVIRNNRHSGTVGFGIIGHGSAAPTTGTWTRGDIILNDTPSASGTIGWVCTTSGTPGTWKTWGTISA